MIKNECSEKYYIVGLKYSARLMDLFKCYVDKCRLHTQIPLELSNKIFYVIIEMKLVTYSKTHITVPTIYGELFNNGIVDDFNTVLNQKLKFKTTSHDKAFDFFEIVPGCETVTLNDLADLVLSTMTKPDIKVHLSKDRGGMVVG